MRLRLLWSVGLVLLLPRLVVGQEPVDYLKQIKPLLAQKCIQCHGPEKQRSSLRLDTATFLRAGGNSGPAIEPGKSASSRLIHAVTGVDGVQAMPPKGERLSAQQVALLRAWIDQGAKAPENEKPAGSATLASRHWSLQPITRATPPVVKNSWARNPIDQFILARLEKEGIKPSPEADRVTLIRRLSLDLLGLPPSPKEVDEFLADTRPDAYERLVDRLLTSPHYGERWARLWLDQARYADSNGYSIDAPRSIWKYRDWVIDAINRDLSFDQFGTWQLAGDLLPNATAEQKVATGFHRNTQINEEGGIDVEQFRVDSIVDRVNTTGAVFLGLTIGCCQCHDHKFDPLAQREYYQFFAFFNNCDEPSLELGSPEQTRKKQELQTEIAALQKSLNTVDPATKERLDKWEANLTRETRALLPPRLQAALAVPPNGRNARQEQEVLTGFRNIDQTRHVIGGLVQPLPFVPAAHLHAMTSRRSLEARITDLKAQVPSIPTTMVMQERKTPRTTNIHLAGDFLRKGAVVAPGTPSVLHPPPTKDKLDRLDLARWLFDQRNPLTARVIVNRWWQVYFGVGLVETENDFGTQGTPPSHPELLDWLASEFMSPTSPGANAPGSPAWSMKKFHKLVVTSATYRQSSKVRPELQTLDARNRLLARQSRLRLEAELVRDVSLASTGLLTRTIGGPSVFPPQPKGVYNLTQVSRDWKPSEGPDRYRRGMYTYFWRSAPHPGLTVFDAPDAGTSCTRRNRSNTPLQALTLLNDQAYLEFAQSLAKRILAEGGATEEGRLAHGFRLCLSRQPSLREKELLTRLLEKQRQSFLANPKDASSLIPADSSRDVDAPQFAAWVMVSRVLLNLDEFITRE